MSTQTHTTPAPPRPWWVAVVAGMTSFLDAAAIVSFGIAIVIFKDALALTPLEVGIASGALTFGIAIGAAAGGRLGDRFGRRPVFTITMMMIVIALGLLVVAPSFPVLLAGAILLGLGSGADLPVSLSSVSEAAAEHNRGKLLGFTNALWLAGAVIATLGGAAAAPAGLAGVRIMFSAFALLAVLILLGRLTIPESERWRVARAERQSGVQTVRADRSGVRELLRAPYAVPFFALTGFATLTGLLANTTGQYNNYVLTEYGGISLQEATLAGLPVLPLSVIGMLWFMRIADKPVRFRYFTIAAIFQVASPAVIAIFGVSIPTYLISIVLQTVGTAFAFEGILRVWAQKSFPTLLRTTATGWIISIQRLLAAGLATITPLLLELGVGVLYGTLSVLALIGCGWAWIVFRTRDKDDAFATEAQLDAAAPAAVPGAAVAS